MNSSGLSQAQLAGVAAGAVLVSLLFLGIAWKIGKLLVKLVFLLFLALALCAGIWWMLVRY